MDRGGLAEVLVRELIDEEVVTAEAGVTLTTVRVEDPERRSSPRWAVAVPGDQRLRTLADDVAPEADPRASSELQAEPGRFGDGAGQGAAEAGRLQHDEQRLRSPGEGGEPTEPVGDGGRAVRGGETPAGQIQDEQVHRSPSQQRTTDGQALIERLRGDDHQPLEADTAGDGLDRIETARKIEPSHDGARYLGFRSEPEDEGGPTAGAVTADGDARRTRQATRSQDRVECREPGPDDPLVGAGLVPRIDLGHLIRKRRDRQRADDPRSCGTPSSPQARDSGVHIGTRVRHRTLY